MASYNISEKENLDDLVTALKEDMISNDEEFVKTMDSCILEGETLGDFQCEKCPKKCKSKGGLSRHVKAKHADLSPTDVDVNISLSNAVGLETFSEIFKNALAKVSSDDCLPLSITNELKIYDANHSVMIKSYSLLQDIIGKFASRGKGEKFLPKFYDAVHKNDNIFPTLSRDASTFLGFEMANHILGYVSHKHLAGTKSSECLEPTSTPDSLSKKEKDIVSYISGYVFGALSRRIRRSKTWHSDVNQKYLNILQNGRSSNLTNDSTLVNIKDRGGLWKVGPEVINIFSSAELLFKFKTQGNVHRIDTAEMVDSLITNPNVLSNFSQIHRLSEIDNELALNFLQRLFTLYLRVRSFSYAKDKIQLYKIEKQKQKARSLRTEIKKSTNTDNKNISQV